jgi:hypothetical protein
MRWALSITAVLVVLLGFYIASPLLALHSIGAAVEIKDAAALAERIEFPAVRRALIRQIMATYRQLTGKRLPLGAVTKRFAISLADPVVARLVTVRGLLDLLGKGDAGQGVKVPREWAPITRSAFKSVWRLWLNSDYFGRDFYVHLPPDAARDRKFTVKLRLIQSRWRIVAIELPEELNERLAQEVIKLSQERVAPQR